VEDIVVVHGDTTLSNLMIDPEGNVGFIDCGSAGRGDRYLDLAVLAGDIADHHGTDAAAGFAAAYGERTWDTAKARFYLDLYELF
jgi:aminoglycoside phosphotransferase